MNEITTLLIANRGEIARRIMNTAREMGLRTVAVYSEPDRDSPHVREADLAVALSGASATESYLDYKQIIAAAKKTGADALHPGYGFLAENASFAEACRDAGLVWVGPPSAAIEKMGLKVLAKGIAREAGVPVAQDAEITTDDIADWESAAREVGYPLLVKASAGGGGKGMRLVEDAADLSDAVNGARREAKNSFGDATVFLERYLRSPRHVEMQVFGDERGGAIHLFERECSIQRRHQKVVEEAPAPGITSELRERMAAASLSLTRELGYVGAGTVEYLVDGEDFYFLEMNTRLQVEHPVTESITNLDLVRLQIQVARGEPLPVSQDEVTRSGHAIEVRLYAEDPGSGFTPAFGTLHRFEPGTTPGVRYDSGVESGSEISTHYDPMLAKIVAHAPTRTEASRRLARALSEMRLHGPTNNRDFLAATLLHQDFLAGETRTDFIEEHPELLLAQPYEAAREVHALACIAALAHRRRACAPVQSFAPGGWRNVRTGGQRISFEASGGEQIEVEYILDTKKAPARLTATLGERTLQAELTSVSEDSVRLSVDGIEHCCRVGHAADTVYINSPDGQTALRELPRFVEPETAAAAGGPTPGLPGAVVAVEVVVGDRVKEGQTLVVVEAMKMEHSIAAAGEAIVDEVLVEVGDTVDAHQLLVSLREAAEEEKSA